jgi:hypothetical protein
VTGAAAAYAAVAVAAAVLVPCHAAVRLMCHNEVPACVTAAVVHQLQGIFAPFSEVAAALGWVSHQICCHLGWQLSGYACWMQQAQQLEGHAVLLVLFLCLLLAGS